MRPMPSAYVRNPQAALLGHAPVRGAASGKGKSAPEPVAMLEGAPAIITWRKTQGRSAFVSACMGLALVAVAGRALFLQHVNNDQWVKRAEVRYEDVRTLSAPRGTITDRHGTPLAVSISETRLGVVPKRLAMHSPKFDQLATLLNEKPATLRKRIQASKGFFYVAEGLDLATTDRLRALRMDGLVFEEDFRRHYPYGEAFAPLLGLVNREGQGAEGVERAFQKLLAPTQGQERVLVDRNRQAFGQTVLRPSQPGSDLRLSVDAALQSMAYAAVEKARQDHKAKGAAAVVLDAQTGEVLAMASAPSLDPNQRAGIQIEKLRNRAILDAFEPGSTLKPFAIATAMDEGVARAQTVIQTSPGHLTINGRTIRDVHPGGAMTVAEVLTKSSNVGTAKLALKVGAEQLHERYALAGLGGGRPVPLPGATGGSLRSWKGWQDIDQVVISYGYGVSVSLVQLASAYTVFTAEGRRLPASLEPLPAAPAGALVFRPDTASAMRQMLASAVGPGGTGGKAQVPGFEVAGKTGTAHKAERGTYAKDRYISSFVGFVPAASPRYVIAVMVDEPSAGQHYGGQVAAPVFSAIAEGSMRRLQMSPDPQRQVLPNLAGVAGGDLVRVGGLR